MSWAARIVPACQELADALTAAGVPATLSRSKLSVGSSTARGGAWVRPDSAVCAQTLAGGATVRVSVLLVSPASDDAEALGDLTALLEKALPVLELAEEDDKDVDTSVLLNVRGNNLPAFRLVTDLEL